MSADSPILQPLRRSVIALALVALVAGVYGQVGGFGFVNFDDGRYVYQNPHVRAGLTWDGVRWAFTAFDASNWHPLTWLSHMLDVQLFGVEPGWHHLVNVLLHAVDTVLLFLLLETATGKPWRSAAVAALFAAHPLHVESVAWIAERKDVLSTAFGLLAMLAYVRWTRRRDAGGYLLIVAAFVLSLLSKPMLVTLPLLLLLLDIWPLRRLSLQAPSAATVFPLVREKVPLFAISVAASALTYLAQAGGGAVSSKAALPLLIRIENALVSYVRYLAMMIWPVDLAVGYPHPGWAPDGIAGWKVAAAVLLLAAVTAAVVLQAKRRPYLAVGWLWYGVTLVPVIGVVQVGLQALADRYTYVPLIGIFIAFTWAVADLAGSSRSARYTLTGAAIALIAISGAMARRQAGFWRDSLTLFQHAVDVVPDDALAWRNLGVAYHETRQDQRAISALKQSVLLMPQDVHAWMDLAVAYTAARQYADATNCFETALQMNPDDPYLLYNVAIAHATQGQWQRAGEAHARLRRVRPDLAEQLATRLGRAVGPR